MTSGSSDESVDSVAGGRRPLEDPVAVPHLELDQLLEQLVDRAREAMATQGRLRGLLRANQVVTQDLELSVVL
ncbi:hypothetical protein, partial [Pseudonocardia oceani]|uniref:hypothetical protein n=1 Tax=Pseudonocardia oceani TaxID=2792013 RepID=UPI0035578A4A